MKLRFTLRSLAFFVLLVAVVFGWWLNKIRSQQFAVAEINRLGGHVSNVHPTSTLFHGPISPPWLPKLLKHVYPLDINSVCLTGEEVNDHHIDLLLVFPDLVDISLSASRISDKSLKQFQRYRNLTQIQLVGVETVSQSGIGELQLAVPECTIIRR